LRRGGESPRRVTLTPLRGKTALQALKISRCDKNPRFVKNRGAWHKRGISQCRLTLHIVKLNYKYLFLNDNFYKNEAFNTHLRPRMLT
jgi:hypothetical protein